MLANIFLHLAFDSWMKQSFPHVPFERYADDIIVHCRTEQQAKSMLEVVRRRFARCKLELHPQKTKIVYCKDSNRTAKRESISFDFLGFTFRPRRSRNHRGEYFASFGPAVSGKAAKAMRETMRLKWRIRRRTDKDLTDLARMFNPVLRGWINYYGSFCRSALFRVFRPLDHALAKWAAQKYKRLKGHRRRSGKWVEKARERNQRLFAHWYLLPSRLMAG